jgi:hypothetical protein
VQGVWSRGREVSDFAGAWLNPPVGWQAPASLSSRPLVRVTGVVMSEPRKNAPRPGGGYGHLGMSSADLDAYRIEVLE